jgi:DNA polymerase elongation subunit (family B)
VKYIECESEYALLNSFLHYWENNTPEVVTGWNIEFFDIPYICGRLNRVLGDKRAKCFSPWGLVSQNEVWVNNRQQICYDIKGISQLDYLKLYKWSPATSNQESYRLDHIANVELGQKKLDHSEFDTFKEFYSGEFNVSLDEEVELGSLRHKGKIRSLLADKLQENK